MELAEITLFLFNILLIIIIVVVYVKLTLMVKNQGLQIQLLLKHEKEGFRIKEAMAPAQRESLASKYVGMENGLVPSDKQYKGSPKYKTALTSERGDRAMSYMLPGANVGGGEIETPIVNSEAIGSALNVSQEDLIKAGAGAIASTDFHDNSTPSTEDLPVQDQRGVVEEPNKEGFCGGNTRVCPSFMSSGDSFMVSHMNQKDGISTSKEGFRPRSRYNA